MPESDPLRICFICTGNICRSPYAEGLLRHIATEEGWGERIVVLSAGIPGLDGRGAHPHTLAAAEAHGFSLAGHRSQNIGSADLPACDLILGMSADHVETIRELLPSLAERTYLLSAYPDRRTDTPRIPDPIGGDEQAFARSCQAIDDALRPLVEALRARCRRT